DLVNQERLLPIEPERRDVEGKHSLQHVQFADRCRVVPDLRLRAARLGDVRQLYGDELGHPFFDQLRRGLGDDRQRLPARIREERSNRELRRNVFLAVVLESDRSCRGRRIGRDDDFGCDDDERLRRRGRPVGRRGRVDSAAQHCDAQARTESVHVEASINGRDTPVVLPCQNSRSARIALLARKLQVWVRRDGNEYSMWFAGGKKKQELKIVGQVGKRNTGTTVRFWPDEQFFDSLKFSVPRLKHVMRAKAVLSPKLRMRFISELDPAESEEWYFEDGLKDYLLSELAGATLVPEPPFVGHFKGHDHEVDWAVVWAADDGEVVGESYVNLIPTTQGGTHVNGFRTGLTEAIREFCEFRDMLPRGVKLAPEDVWARCCSILSVRMTNPQFTGQTKDRLSSREASAFVSGVTQDAFSIWLNNNVAQAEKIAQIAIEQATTRLKQGKK